MSCCGGNCGCGSGCKCGSGCSGCRMYPDLSFSDEGRNPEIIIDGVAHVKGFEMITESQEGDCKCGPNCNCNPCNCK